ncbi:MAG: uracil-DNA glycosylase [Clostridia bacterium]
MVYIGNDWDEILAEDFASGGYAALRSFLANEYKTQTVYPDMYDIFNALKTTSYEDTRVVILGQDPYHNPGEAHGMCFSVKAGVKVPPSLANIYKELQADLGIFIPNNGYLKPWAEQGVLLLNTIFTVRAGAPLSHKNKGWETITDSIIANLNNKQDPIVFLLWGANARSKKALLTNPSHYILESPHPSPLSAYYGFFGSRHFSKANKFLKESGFAPIDWQIPNI